MPTLIKNQGDPIPPGMAVDIHTVHGAQIIFADDQVPGSATSVARSLREHTTIDAVGVDGGLEPARYIIPFYAIDSAVIAYTQPEHTTPVDDNCTVGGDPDPDDK